MFEILIKNVYNDRELSMVSACVAWLMRQLAVHGRNGRVGARGYPVLRKRAPNEQQEERLYVN